MKAKTKCVFAMLALLSVCPYLDATEARIQVVDETGMGVPEILVIVKSLEFGKGVDFRALSGKDGFVPPVDLRPGLYQAIATDPYGPWFTKVQEFVMAKAPLTIRVAIRAAIIDSIPIWEAHVKVRVRDANGAPVPGAKVIGRDPAAQDFDLAETDAQGLATVGISGNGAEVVVVYGDQVHSEWVEIRTSSIDCCHDCYLIASKRMRKKEHSLTINLPLVESKYPGLRL